jgi:hypothetical protein
VLASIAAGADPAEADLDDARERLDTFLVSPLSDVNGMSRDMWEWRVAMGLTKSREA